MPTLIKGRQIASNSWRLLDEPDAWLRTAEDGRAPAFPAAGGLIVPLALWRQRREDLIRRAGPVGVRLAIDEGPEAIAADLEHLALVAVHFPKFNDGRGFSTARLLRERYGYRGEVRAVGDVLRDQLLFLQRCGFDAFELRDDQNPSAALAAFDDLPAGYQSAVDEPLPLFRRRLAVAAGKVAQS